MAAPATSPAFCEALRMELRSTGVSVTALCPGPVHTEFDSIARRATNPDQRVAPEFAYVSVEQVVQDAIASVQADKPIVIPSFAMKVATFIVRLTPMPLLRPAAWASHGAR